MNPADLPVPPLPEETAMTLPPALDTLDLVASGDRTLCTATATYDTKEIRDMVASSGAEQGIIASYNRLANLVAELARV